MAFIKPALSAAAKAILRPHWVGIAALGARYSTSLDEKPPVDT